MDSPATRLLPDTSRVTSDYRAAIDFLFGRIDYERVPKMPYTRRDLNLDRMRRLLELLDNPQNQVRVIHVAGTKGKGSTTALLSSTLTAAGFRCGAYTSPHLHHIEERFVLDESACSPAELVQLIDRVRPAVLQMDEETDGRGPTYFEITTAIAFEFFMREQVDVAIFEVGLGGRLDSTNVCQPLVSVITSISYDHTRQLGNTLKSIATEKAGIIKRGITVVSGATDVEAKDAISSVSERQHSLLRQLGTDFRFTYHTPQDARADETGLLDFEVCEHDTWRPWLESIPLGLLGRHQATNAAVAIASLRELPSDLTVPEDAIRQGFKDARCPARVELLDTRPLTIVDGAHNVASIEALIAVLNDCFPGQSRSLLLATTRGKDVAGMLRVLLPEFDRVVCSRYLNNPRAFDPRELGELACTIGKDLPLPCAERITWCTDPTAAWNKTIAETPATDLICVTGSFFIAAEIRQLITSRRDEGLSTNV